MLINLVIIFFYQKSPELLQELREKYPDYKVYEWAYSKGINRLGCFDGLSNPDIDGSDTLEKLIGTKEVEPKNLKLQTIISESEELNFLPIGTYVELDKRVFDSSDGYSDVAFLYWGEYLKNSKSLTGVIVGHKTDGCIIGYSVLLSCDYANLMVMGTFAFDMVKPLNLMPKGVVTEDCETSTPRMIVDVLQSPDSEIQYKTLSLSNPHEIKSFQAQDLKMVEFPVMGSVVKVKSRYRSNHDFVVSMCRTVSDFADLMSSTMVVLQNHKTLTVDVAVLPCEEGRNIRFLEIPLYALEWWSVYTEDFELCEL